MTISVSMFILGYAMRGFVHLRQRHGFDTVSVFVCIPEYPTDAHTGADRSCSARLSQQTRNKQSGRATARS